MSSAKSWTGIIGHGSGEDFSIGPGDSPQSGEKLYQSNGLLSDRRPQREITSCSSKEEASAIALGYGEWANRAGHGYLSLARSFVKERNKCVGMTAVET